MSDESRTYWVVKVDSDTDTYAAETLSESVDLAMPDGPYSFGRVKAKDAGSARLAEPDPWFPSRLCTEQLRYLQRQVTLNGDPEMDALYQTLEAEIQNCLKRETARRCICIESDSLNVDPSKFMSRAADILDAIGGSCLSGHTQIEHDDLLPMRAKYLIRHAISINKSWMNRIGYRLLDNLDPVLTCGLDQPWGGDAPSQRWVETAVGSLKNHRSI